MSTGFLEKLDGGAVTHEKVLLSDDFCPLFEKNGLCSLLDFMSLPVSNSFRSVKERLTVGLDLEEEGGESVRVYLKRHWSDSPGQTPAPQKEAFSEWDNLRELKENNIPVPAAMAVGHGVINGHSCAFVVMKEVPGTQADDFIEENFSGPSDPELKEFMIKLGEFASQFHNAGYNHRDFYLCHTFVKKSGDDYIFHLIDLQRVQKKSLLRRRWIVKDLAQLNYSALKLVDDAGRRAFYESWCSGFGISPQKLESAVERKTLHMVKREEQGKAR